MMKNKRVLLNGTVPGIVSKIVRNGGLGFNVDIWDEEGSKYCTLPVTIPMTKELVEWLYVYYDCNTLEEIVGKKVNMDLTVYYYRNTDSYRFISNGLDFIR